MSDFSRDRRGLSERAINIFNTLWQIYIYSFLPGETLSNFTPLQIFLTPISTMPTHVSSEFTHINTQNTWKYAVRGGVGALPQKQPTENSHFRFKVRLSSGAFSKKENVAWGTDIKKKIEDPLQIQQDNAYLLQGLLVC